MKIKIPITLRLFIAGKLESEKGIDVPERELAAFIDGVAARHAKAAAGRPYLVEIEFLTEPPASRFYRIGTDKPNAAVHFH